MIVGIGVDTVEVRRIEHFRRIPKFVESTFTSSEISNCHGNEAVYYATRLACKEAVFKAIGFPKDWRKIEILNHEDGKPYISNKEYREYNIYISITTGIEFTTAFCVVEKLSDKMKS